MNKKNIETAYKENMQQWENEFNIGEKRPYEIEWEGCEEVVVSNQIAKSHAYFRHKFVNSFAIRILTMDVINLKDSEAKIILRSEGINANAEHKKSSSREYYLDKTSILQLIDVLQDIVREKNNV